MGANQSSNNNNNKALGPQAIEPVERGGSQKPANKQSAIKSSKGSFTKHQLNKLLRRNAIQQVANEAGDEFEKHFVAATKSERAADLIEAMKRPPFGVAIETGRLNGAPIDGVFDRSGDRQQAPLLLAQTVRSQQEGRANGSKPASRLAHRPEQTSANNFSPIQQRQARVAPEFASSGRESERERERERESELELELRRERERDQERRRRRLMSLESRFNCSSTSATTGGGGGGAMAAANMECHKSQLKPFKSSCSPSSAGSCGSGSSSSSASSFHELEGARSLTAAASAAAGRNIGRPAGVQLARIVSTQTQFQPPDANASKQHESESDNDLNQNNNNSSNSSAARQQQRKLNPGEQARGHYANEALVAMQQSRPQHHLRQHYHQRTSSLSWSKQAASLAYQQQQQADQLDSLERRHRLSNGHFPIQQAQRSAIATTRNLTLGQAEEIEQFYTRNLHLLTRDQQQLHFDLDEAQARQLELDPYGNSLLYAADFQQLAPTSPGQHHFQSAHSERQRYKWPESQCQYFMPPGGQNNAQLFQEDLAAVSQQRPLSPLAYQQQQQPIGADYALLNYYAAPNESLIYYNSVSSTTNTSINTNTKTNSNNNNNLSHQDLIKDYEQQTGRGGLNCSLYAPSAFSKTKAAPLKAATLASRPAKKSRNPLAAIFAFNQAAPAEPSQASSGPKHQYHSNTIHLAGSKSHQNLQQARGSAAAGGSLKRVKSTPLTAQQTSYEAMRTIDMYLIRQIARSCMDYEMEQKIDLEIRLRELASQSLLEARNEIDVLEVEKSLLTSDQRMNCYASELEQQRKQLSNPSLSTDSGRASKVRTRRDGSLGRTRAAAVAVAVAVAAAASGGAVGATSDVIGGDQQSLGTGTGTGSPSCASQLSKSSQSSPSKLSPVSGESANSVSGGSSCQGSRAVRAPSSSQDGGSALTRRRNGASNKSSSASSVASKCAKERERLEQLITSQSNINCNMVSQSKATLSLSELRIPLMWRDVDHFKNRGDYRRYAVFCLLKMGSQIYDTQLISDVDRQQTDLTFDDVIVFNNVEHTFELTLEVYSCVYFEQFSLASTPRKLREKLSNSVSRAMGRRLATQTASVNFTKELEAYDKSYRFALIASARLRLPDADHSIKTYDLRLLSPEAHGRHSTSSQFNQANFSSSSGPYGSSSGEASVRGQPYHNHNGLVTASNQKDQRKNTLPLFGHFCCKLLVRPDVFDKCVKSGYLRIGAIHLPESMVGNGGKLTGSDSDKQQQQQQQQQQARTQRVRGRCDSSDNDDSGKSSSFNDDPPPPTTIQREPNGAATTVSNDTNSMLRSALAASSKLATISMSTANIHWALLRNFTLHLWQIDELKLQLASRRGHAPQVDISCKQPFCINIDRFTRLLRVSNSSLTIETDKGCFVIAVHNLDTTNKSHRQDEISQWLRPIEQMIYDSHIWGSALHHYPPASQRIRHSPEQ